MTAAEVQALAKLAYVAWAVPASNVTWEYLKSAEQERWRAVVRTVARDLNRT